MFEVLAFVYEHFESRDACPDLPVLHRALVGTHGFDSAQVQSALLWLEDLKSATRRRPGPTRAAPSGTGAPAGLAACRVLTAAEQRRVQSAGWGFLAFLTTVGALFPDELELVLERALAASDEPLHLPDLKLIVLMVLWGLDREPDALVLDLLCDSPGGDWAH